MPFNELIAEVEAILLNPDATHDEDNPACDDDDDENGEEGDVQGDKD